jgi:hypothetical protein
MMARCNHVLIEDVGGTVTLTVERLPLTGEL